MNLIKTWMVFCASQVRGVEPFFQEYVQVEASAAKVVGGRRQFPE